MANLHYTYNPSTSTHGKFLQSAASSLEETRRTINKAYDVFQTFLVSGGDVGQAATFADLKVAIGAADDATAKSIFDELSSVRFKLNTDSSVTDVAAAINQFINRITV